MRVQPVALNARRSVGCALMQLPAIARSPSKPAYFARTSATGVQFSATRTTWITVSAAPKRAVVAPRLAARWPFDLCN